MTGIGHEVDESLADLAADVRASTPSNAAELLTYDREAVGKHLCDIVKRAGDSLIYKITQLITERQTKVIQVSDFLLTKVDNMKRELVGKIQILTELNPEKVLERGYAILKGDIDIGNVVKITTIKREIKAEIKEIHERN